MKYRLLFVGLLLLCAGTARGQIDPDPDGVGVYADLDGMINEVEQEVGVPMEVYLLLTRAAGRGFVAGWECRLVIPDNVSVWAWSVPVPGAIVLTDPPSYMAGYPDGFPSGQATLLMTLVVVPLDSEPAQFLIEPYPYTNPHPYPRYLDCEADGSDVIPRSMYPYPDGNGQVSFTINPDPTPVASATWGEVKALYR